jgi:hypothetical protein
MEPTYLSAAVWWSTRRKKPPSAVISVFDMFYDEDNEKLCENYPRHMIYEPSDFP